MERHCKASNDGLLRKRKLFYHLKSPQFLFHEDTVRNGHQYRFLVEKEIKRDGPSNETAKPRPCAASGVVL